MASPLPLYEGAKPCVQCGYCCSVAPCSFGAWDPVAQRCTHLTADNLCARYDEILALPAREWWHSPAFGAGCCSSLNERYGTVMALNKSASFHP